MDKRPPEPGPEIATTSWVNSLQRRRPRLFGQLGRAPTRKERRNWLRNAEKNRKRLIAMKYQYLRSRLKVDMVAYLELRRKLGYVEGVAIPHWLLTVGHKKKQSSVVARRQGEVVSLAPATEDPDAVVPSPGPPEGDEEA